MEPLAAPADDLSSGQVAESTTMPTQRVNYSTEGSGPEFAAADPNGDTPTARELIELMKWHLSRYDQLRSSTANRASVVLSASAVLSAGNALVLNELHSWLTGPTSTLVVSIAAAALLSSMWLTIKAAIGSSRVLVTPKGSRTIFDAGSIVPSAPLFNGGDTIREYDSFADFSRVAGTQTHRDILLAAQVELWIVIKQHRYRYLRLRQAARALRQAAAAFLLLLGGMLVTAIALRF